MFYPSILWVTFWLHKLCLPHSCSINFRMLSRLITWCLGHQSAFSLSSDCLSVLQGKTILSSSAWAIVARADGISGSLDLTGLWFSVSLRFSYILSGMWAWRTLSKESIIHRHLFQSLVHILGQFTKQCKCNNLKSRQFSTFLWQCLLCCGINMQWASSVWRYTFSVSHLRSHLIAKN